MNTTYKIVALIVAVIILIGGYAVLSVIDSPVVGNTPEQPAPTLIGKWVWRDAVMQNEEVVSPALGKEEVFTIEFTEAGEVRGTTDCNGFGGTYEADGQMLTFGPFMSTLMFCEGSQEAVFVDFINRSEIYTFDVMGNLILVFKGEEGAMILEKVM